MVYQREICPSSDRLHWQGYLVLAKKSTLSWLKNNIDSGAHWEKAKGDVQSNVRYCTKDESRVPGTTPVEIGELEF